MTATAYWVLGIPSTLLLVFYFPFGIAGIWVGPTIAVLFLTVAYTTVFLGIDW